MEKKRKIIHGFHYYFLRINTLIHPWESKVAFLLALNIFLLLAGYYLIKPAREAFILAAKGPEVRSYLAAFQVLLLFFIVEIFSHLSSKFPRQKLITWVTAFFISNLIIFYILYLIQIPQDIFSIIFFIWVGIFNVTVIAQFWAFANDIYTHEVGKRLFPLIALGATSGAFVGGRIAVHLTGTFAVPKMMLITAGILVVCIFLSAFIHKIEIKKLKEIDSKFKLKKAEEKYIQEKPLKKGGGFKIVFKSKYLLYIAFLVLLLNLINNNGMFILNKMNIKIAVEAIQSETAEGLNLVEYLYKLNADLNSTINFWAMLIQLILVSRIFTWFKIRGGLLFLPLIAFGGYLFLSFGATWALIRGVKIMENSANYSLMNTTRHALFLVTPREAKYKANAAIDTFFHRAGPVFSALVVLIGTSFFSMRLENFAILNVFFAAILIIFCLLIMREHKRKVKEQEISDQKMAELSTIGGMRP